MGRGRNLFCKQCVIFERITWAMITHTLLSLSDIHTSLMRILQWYVYSLSGRSHTHGMPHIISSFFILVIVFIVVASTSRRAAIIIRLACRRREEGLKRLRKLGHAIRDASRDDIKVEAVHTYRLVTLAI